MKTNIWITILALTLVVASCENDLNRPIVFDVTPETSAGVISATAFTVSAGTKIKFNFTGDPDFITFYSGENGHEYSKRHLFTIPANEITSVLKFANMPQYGTIPNTLKLYFSTEFPGLTGKNKQSDSTLIVDHAWTEVSNLANFSTGSNVTTQSEIPLNDYLGKKLTIAFKYDPKQNTATQPTWILTGLQIENTFVANGATSLLKANSMGFKPFDMFSNSPYTTETTTGIWNLTKIGDSPSVIRISSSPAGRPINEDWLISNPILVNSRSGDTGQPIKNMTVDVKDYTYTFNSAGVYTVTFVARNSNYSYDAETIKEFTITVN